VLLKTKKQYGKRDNYSFGFIVKSNCSDCRHTLFKKNILVFLSNKRTPCACINKINISDKNNILSEVAEQSESINSKRVHSKCKMEPRRNSQSLEHCCVHIKILIYVDIYILEAAELLE
jgi:hypothetical protein